MSNEPNTNDETKVAIILAAKRNGAIDAIVRIVESYMGGADLTDHVQSEIAAVVESLTEDLDVSVRVSERHRIRDLLAAEARELRCVAVDDPACVARCRTAAGYDEAAELLVQSAVLDTGSPAPMYCVQEFDDGWSAFLCDHGTGTEGLPSREDAIKETHRLFNAAFAASAATIRDMEVSRCAARIEQLEAEVKAGLAEQERLQNAVDEELSNRERLEDVIDRVKEILGIEAEWTNCYGHKNFLQDVGEAVAAHERVSEENSRLAISCQLYDEDQSAMRKRMASMRDLLQMVVNGDPFTAKLAFVSSCAAVLDDVESPSLIPKEPT